MVLDRYVPAFDIAGFVEAFAERGRVGCADIGRAGVDEPDHRQRRLLRACCERPRGCRAADKRDEFAASHSITSSARSRSDSGIVSPSALAVLRLMAISN